MSSSLAIQALELGYSKTQGRSQSERNNAKHMTPIIAGTPDSSASFAKLQDSLNRLRHTLNQCAIRHSQLAQSSQLESVDANKELQTLSQVVLSQTVVLKLAHEAIIRDVNDSRQKIRNDQEELLKARMRLQNLEYEKRMLQSEISECRAMKSPKLEQTKVSLPTSLFDASESDEAMARNLKTVNTALQEELTARKKIQAEVEMELRETEVKQSKLNALREALRQIPLAVKAIAAAVEPVRHSVNSDPMGVGSREELERMTNLPAPLYILAREAVAYREAFDPTLTVHVTTNGDGDKDSCELYRKHKMTVVLEVGAEENMDDARLRVFFRYLETLGIVVVSVTVVVDGQECDEYPTKELRVLFPRDSGDVSPRACNAHLEGGSFVFNVNKAGGRPFYWANVLCGVECLPPINRSDAVGHGSEWVRELLDLTQHNQFREVLSALQRRLLSAVHLKRHVDWLMEKKICVKATDIGFKTEARARVDDFVRLGWGDWNPEGLVREGENGRDTEVWSMRVVGTDGMVVSCLIAIEPDYPFGRPTFRLKFEGGLDGVSERDVTDMERCVNDLEIGGALTGRSELLLGAQVTALLAFVDRVEDAHARANGEVIENEIKPEIGRSRSKIDVLLKG